MSTISVDQRLSLLARLGENINWDSLTTEQIQVGIREAKRAGAEATVFFKNGFRVQIGDFFRDTGELALQIPALPRPTLAELREKFSWIRAENGIERDTSPTEAVTLRLGTVLRADEKSIGGEEYERRRVSLTGLHGYQQAAWLVEHQDEFPEVMALLGKVYIDFPGLVVASADGDRNFPYLYRVGKRWDLRWRWTVYDLFSSGRIASSGK